jgi:D-alanine-D-alanine ligase
MVTMTAPVEEKLRILSESKKYGVYLNVCEGYEFEDEEDDEIGYQSIEIVQALEKLNLPFTGADTNCFDPTREEMQAVADANGIGFAKGYQVKNAEEAEHLVKNLRYPIMVKHPKSYGSTGMTKDSRADTLEQVLTQVNRICAEFGAARMEEFIVGKEYNVLVVENADDLSQPIAYPPAELVFPPDEEFWHVDVKWNYDVVFDFKEVTDPELIAKLHEIAQRMFLAMGVSGYGRCDIRMNEKGELYILEINPNGGIMFKPEEYGPADYMILYDKDGYKGFFDRIFKAALLRQKMRVGK